MSTAGCLHRAVNYTLMASPQALWHQIRLQLLARQTAGDPTLRHVILESWQRSRDAGVNPEGQISLRRIDLDELKTRRTDCRRLLEAATPLIDDFSRSLRDR